MSHPYRNRFPALLDQEKEAAHRVGLTPVEVPSAAFDILAAQGVRMIYVVAGGRLVASRRKVGSEHISHAVLADGGPAQAAGEFEIVAEDGTLVVSALNNMSGHYRPAAASLEVACRAFEAAGIRVRSDAVRSYNFGAL